MAQKTFFAVLEEQLRRDLRTEIETELRAKYGLDTGPSTGPDFESRVVNPGVNPGVKPIDKTTEFWRMPPLASVRKPAPHAKSAYAGPSATSDVSVAAPRSAPTRPEPAVRPVTPEEVVALTLLQRAAQASFSDEVTARELKSLWRRAALRTHPDLHAQADVATQAKAAAHFRELTAAFETLGALFEVSCAEAA